MGSADHRLTIDLLGPLRVCRDGEDVPMPSAKERLVLALLAVQVPHPVSFATLADAVWPEATNDNWRKALQLHVFRLRKRLSPAGTGNGHETIVTLGGGYALALDPEVIDLHAFETGVASGREHLADGRPGDAARALAEALGLWRGEPLADLAGTPAGEAHVARLSELRLAAVEAHHEAELALGHHERILPDLEADVVEHPLRERLWRLLMVALYRSGRQSDALRAYQRARSHLVEELGLEPGPDLRRVEAAIVAQDADLDWVAPAAAKTPPRDLGRGLGGEPGPRWATRLRTVPFRGRAPELTAIRSAWRRLEADGIQIVCVTGPEGIGKTRLLAEVAVECTGEGVEVDTCWCARAGQEPYGPLRGLAREGEPTGSPPLSPSDLVAWARHRTATGALALLVDEVGGADPGTVEALQALVRAGDDLPLLLIVTQRLPDRVPGHVQDFLVDASRHPGHRKVELTGLDVEDGVALMSMQLGRSDDGVPLDLATAYHEASGNPLHLLELTNHAIERANLDPAGRITVGSVMGESGLPESLRVRLRRRRDLLDDHARTVLGAASVLGSTFDFRMVAQVAGRSEDDTVAALEDAARVGLVRDASDAVEVEFTSTVVRAGIYRDLTSPRRALLHQRAGELLASADAAPVATRLPAVVDHFARGQSSGPAVTAARPNDQFGPERLAPAYEAAMSWFEASLVEAAEPAEDQHCGLLLGLATGRWRSGDLGAAQELFQRAAREARGLERADLLAAAACGLAQVVLEVGVTHPPVMALLEESQRLLDDDHPLQEQIRAAIVPELVWAGRWKDAVQVAHAMGASRARAES